MSPFKIKNASLEEAIIVWSKFQDNPTIYSELPLRDLRFAGEVLAQVEVKTGIRTKPKLLLAIAPVISPVLALRLFFASLTRSRYRK